MGTKQEQKVLFSYGVDLDRRVRADNPLRRIRERIDFSFVREQVQECYGYNGNVSEDPAVIMKMMFLRSSPCSPVLWVNAWRRAWWTARRSTWMPA
jgi:transposase